MAISLLGVSTAGASDTGSQNINVPSGTTSVILMAGGWDDLNFHGLTAATLGGVSFSFTAGYQVHSSGNTQGYYLADISDYTGSTGAAISLGYTCNGAISEGLVFGIFCFSGADTTGMIRAKDFDTAAGTPAVLSTTVTSVSTDIVIGGGVGFTTEGPPDVGSPASQTESASAASNSDTGSFGFEITTGASSTTFTTNSIDFAALTTVSIKEAAAAGLSIPVAMNAYRQNHQSVV